MSFVWIIVITNKSPEFFSYETNLNKLFGD